GGAPPGPGAAARPRPGGGDGHRPRQSRAHPRRAVSRRGVQRDASRARGPLFHGAPAAAGTRAAAYRARREARPHEPAAARAALRSRRLPQRGDLLRPRHAGAPVHAVRRRARARRSEEHTSELQSPCNLVCRLLLEKKNDIQSTQLLYLRHLEVRAVSAFTRVLDALCRASKGEGPIVALSRPLFLYGPPLA